MSQPDPVVFQGATGPELRFREWARLCCGRDEPWISLLQTRDPAVVFTALIRTFLEGRSLTLIDHDWDAALLRQLDLDPDAVNRAVPPADCAALPKDWSALLAGLGEHSAGRLTLYTSGTTGLPKAITHSYASLTRGIRVGPAYGQTRWALAYTPTHMAGLQVFLQAFLNQAPLYSLWGLPPADAVDRLRAAQITHLSATPTYYRLLLPAMEPLETVQGITVGGERLDSDLRLQLAITFPRARLRNVYATTEAGSLFASSDETFTVPDRYAAKVRVEEGRLLLHRSLLGAGAASGANGEWIPTGDVVEVLGSDPLQLRFLHREGSLVKVGGFPVNLEAVEEVLRSHQDVIEARVVARPNSVTGMLLEAEIVTGAAHPDPADLQAFLRARLAPAAVPRVVRRVEAIPLTRSLKREASGRPG